MAQVVSRKIWRNSAYRAIDRVPRVGSKRTKAVAKDMSGSKQVRRSRKLQIDQFLPARLANVSRRLSKFIARQYAKEFGLSIPEWRVIVHIAHVNSCSSGDVCTSTTMDKPMVHRAVTRLAALGYITAQISHEDRRSNVLKLSKRGKAVYDRIVPIVLEQEEFLLDGLSVQERKSLLKLLAKLQSRMDGLDEDRRWR